MVMTDGGRLVRDEGRFKPVFEKFARMIGFGLDEVVVTGHAFTADTDIYAALDLDNVRTFFVLDTAAVRTRIQRLPWVATVALTRVFPGRLEVAVTERRPFAVWRRGQHDVLVDRTGRELAAVKYASVRDLPLVTGEGANEHVASVMAMLDRFPALKPRVEAADWVSQRRWTLRLSGNVVLQLPADRELAVLGTLHSEGTLEKILSAPNRLIDVRGADRISVRALPVPHAQGKTMGSGT